MNSNSGQINSQDWETVLCLTGQKYTITVGSTSSYWSSSSFLYLNAILDENDYEDQDLELENPAVDELGLDTIVYFPHMKMN